MSEGTTEVRSHGQLPLPAWAVEVYGRPDVRKACLRLQDDHDADVVAVLAVAWASAGVDGVDWSELVRWALSEHQWHDDVVVPLRKVRRKLFDGPLRRQVAQVEIEAELTQLAQLAVSFPSATIRRAPNFECQHPDFLDSAPQTADLVGNAQVDLAAALLISPAAADLIGVVLAAAAQLDQACRQPNPGEPAARQPAASQPAASQPAASQPAASQPVASQPTRSVRCC